MNPPSLGPRAGPEGPDKVDMSLDDIIRMNKKQQQLQGHKAALRKHKLAVRGRLNQGRRVGPPLQRGGGAGKTRGPKLVLSAGGKRRGQGVITGLAARRTALLKGISPLNRPALSPGPRIRRAPSRAGPGRVTFNAFAQRPRPTGAPRRQTYTQSWTHTQPDTHKAPPHRAHRPFQLRRKWNGPPAHDPQREARQATFLSRRGLKVQTHVQKMGAPSAPRNRPWRTPQTNTGILTVSIDNPSARTQPEPAHSWSLHPPTPGPAPAPAPASAPVTAEEPERKPPKGVALQFDINSVGTQTAMTLNERFRILKDKRVEAAKQSSKGGRFVTVG